MLRPVFELIGELLKQQYDKKSFDAEVVRAKLLYASFAKLSEWRTWVG
jgi:hypothetical protein